MPLRITGLKFLPPVARGYKRTYEQCRTCDRVYYRDYVPFSLANPILTLPCGHGTAHRHEHRVRFLPEQAGALLMLEQEATRREAERLQRELNA